MNKTVTMPFEVSMKIDGLIGKAKLERSALHDLVTLADEFKGDDKSYIRQQVEEAVIHLSISIGEKLEQALNLLESVQATKSELPVKLAA